MSVSSHKVTFTSQIVNFKMCYSLPWDTDPYFCLTPAKGVETRFTNDSKDVCPGLTLSRCLRDSKLQLKIVFATQNCYYSTTIVSKVYNILIKILKYVRF